MGPFAKRFWDLSSYWKSNIWHQKVHPTHGLTAKALGRQAMADQSPDAFCRCHPCRILSWHPCPYLQKIKADSNKVWWKENCVNMYFVVHRASQWVGGNAVENARSWVGTTEAGWLSAWAQILWPEAPALPVLNPWCWLLPQIVDLTLPSLRGVLESSHVLWAF